MPSSLRSSSLFSVGILGSGRMAQSLGALLVSRSVNVRAVAARNTSRAEEARRFIGAELAATIPELSQHADLLLIAVSDSAIEEVAQQVAAGPVLPRAVLHTSGAASLEVLAVLHQRGVATGVLHPLQTTPSPERGAAALAGAAYGYGGDDIAEEQALLLIQAVGGQPLRIHPDRWAEYHAATVMACNFQAPLLAAALELMEQAGVDRESALAALSPIMRATTDNLLAMGPEAALTGPIRRGDAETVRRHLGAMQSASGDTRSLYLAAAKSTLSLARLAGLSDENAEPLAALLDESN
jgi:predicted short-subunit dehydrogenase-like oxidoreductase (DUF2520 family)